MNTAVRSPHARYAAVVEASKRIRWNIDLDVIRGRDFDFDEKFLPDELSLVDELVELDDRERRLLGQIQGRTYANIFGLVERFINAKVLEISREHWLGDQVALESLVRFSDEELKHQELFRRIDRMIGKGMPAGYTVAARTDDVAAFVLGKSTWAVLALTCHIELFTLVHYRSTIEPDPQLSRLFKDVFRFHWLEESQHAIVDELEWRAEDARLTPEARDQAVDDLIELVGAVDGILQAQASADAMYFAAITGRDAGGSVSTQVRATLLRAYRWQYIRSGIEETRFVGVLGDLITPAQLQRINDALAPLAS